jgi:hypothetical protein
MLAGLNIPLRRSPGAQSSPRSNAPEPARCAPAVRAKPAPAAIVYDCFISYAGEDCEVVKGIVGALEAAGAKVWWDKGQIRLGDHLTQKIDEGLSQSRYGLMVISPAFVGKHWPESVANRTIRAGHRVILPVLLGMEHEVFASTYPLLGDIVSTTFRGDFTALAIEIVDAMDGQ